MNPQVYYEDGLWKFDLDRHTTLIDPDKTVLEEKLDWVESLTASRREEV